MLWGQINKVYTDHNNLTKSALGLDCDCVHRWRLLLEEFGPKIVYIKGIHNTVADAISRLYYDPDINVMNMHHTERRTCLATAMVQLNTDYIIEK